MCDTAIIDGVRVDCLNKLRRTLRHVDIPATAAANGYSVTHHPDVGEWRFERMTPQPPTGATP